MRPWLRWPGDQRVLDAALAGTLAWGLLQVLPLPPAIVSALSPRRGTLLGAMALGSSAGWQPISINPSASLHAWLVFASAAIVFWCSRALFSHQGIRAVTRSVAAFGLIASAVGILQEASRTRLVYWLWTPLSDGPPGFGPFINRNHFSAWAVMALSLTVGYIAARTQAGDTSDRPRTLAARLARRLDSRTVWLAIAIFLMTVAVVVSLSRSGMAAGATAFAAAHLLGDRRGHERRRPWSLATLILVLAVLWTGPTTLFERWRASDVGQQGRAQIWRETLPVVQDFWLAGTGAGTYGDAMVVYQRSDRGRVHYNQAHNHYLQVLAEQGVVGVLLAVAALAALIAAAWRRLAHDHSGMQWIRIGAAAGLVGLAASSIWETAARMPAVAALTAVLAAVLLHEERGKGRASAPRP